MTREKKKWIDRRYLFYARIHSFYVPFRFLLIQSRMRTFSFCWCFFVFVLEQIVLKKLNIQPSDVVNNGEKKHYLFKLHVHMYIMRKSAVYRSLNLHN